MYGFVSIIVITDLHDDIYINALQEELDQFEKPCLMLFVTLSS